MAVHGIRDSGHNVQAARSAYSVAAVGPRAAQRASAPVALDRSTSVNISDGAQLLGKLRRLHDSHPKEFKQLMSSLADEAQERASQSASGSASRLGKLAERFSEAAREGNITPLVPDLERAHEGRRAYLQQRDALVAPSDDVKAMFRGFVDKVNAALPANTSDGARTLAR